MECQVAGVACSRASFGIRQDLKLIYTAFSFVLPLS